MFIKHMLPGLKAQRIAIYERNIVAEAFPTLLAHCLQMLKVTNIFGHEQILMYDWQKLVQFKINLGGAIYNKNYDMIDDILLDFLSTYHYKKVTPRGKLVMFMMEFPEEAKNAFVEKCNAFKGKDWDEIVCDLVDAIYSLLESTTVHGNKLF